MNWRLGVDLGETSLGWCAFLLDSERGEPCGFLDAGVRIFPSGRDPKSREPLAVSRRLARQRRRQLDRRMRRQRATVKFLVDVNLLPASEVERKEVFEMDPYRCRAFAATGEATPYEVGRALAHLAKRRGFRSSRKDVTDEEKTGGSLREGISRLKSELGDKTLGQLLWGWQQEKGRSVRFRKGSDVYPERWMYQKEFDLLAEVNKSLLSDLQWAQLRDRLVFFQRKLRPVERGKCAVRHELDRAPTCLPSYELYRTWENVNNLRWIDEDGNEHRLDDAQRHAFVGILVKAKSKKFSDLGESLPKFSYFKQASEIRPSLEGCPVTVEFTKAKLPGWAQMSLEEKDAVVSLFLDLDNQERSRPLAKRLGVHLDASEDFFVRLQSLAEAWGIDVSLAAKLAKLADNTRGSCSYCPELLREVIPIMEEKGCSHKVALELELGYPSMRDEWNGSLDELPYYGEVLRRSCLFADPAADQKTNPELHFGKIGNPTVHVALNQLRVVINALIYKYGKPSQIVLELARDLKNGQKAKKEILKQQLEDKKRNDRARTKLEEHGLTVNRNNLLKMKLWEELGEDSVERRCVFSGQLISFNQLFSTSSTIEVEHILPFSRTYDNSISNKTLAFKGANTLKSNRSPFEAFGNGQHENRGYVWEDILRRSKVLPLRKRQRFESAAIGMLDGEEWLGRQLQDTAYVSKQAALYLRSICNKVWTIPGRLTGFLRSQWELLPLLGQEREKNRDDHRHHAVDAFVVGLTSRSLYNYLSRASGRGLPVARELLDRHKSQGEIPLAELRDAFAQRLDTMLVSFKPDHNVNQRFVKDTAYGVVASDGKSALNLVTRVQVDSLEKAPILRGRQFQSLLGDKSNAQQVKSSLSEAGARRVRVLSSNASVKSFDSAPYKAYALDGYAWCDVWRLNDPKKSIKVVFVNYWEALQIQLGKLSRERFRPVGGHEARKLMTLRKDDAFRLSGSNAVFRVVKFKATQNSLVFEPLHLSGEKDKYHIKKSINVLVKEGIQRLSISPIGGVGRDASYRRGSKSRRGST